MDAKRLSDEQAASKLRTIKDNSKTDKSGDGGNAAQKPLADSEGTKIGSEDDAEAPSGKRSSKDAEDTESSGSPAQEKDSSEQAEGDGEGAKSVAGRKKMKSPKSKEERLVEAELNQILKRSPGKSYTHLAAFCHTLLTYPQ